MWTCCKELGKAVLFVAVLIVLAAAFAALREWEKLGAELRAGVRQMVSGVEGER